MRRFQKCYVIYLFFIHLHFYNYFYLCTQVLRASELLLPASLVASMSMCQEARIELIDKK